MKSLIIPTWRPNEIDRCLDSIKKNTTDYEIILDTGHDGFVTSLNRAIKKSKGDHIILLHDDCTVNKGWADKLADVGSFKLGEMDDSFEIWGGFYFPQSYCLDPKQNPDYSFFLCLSKKALKKIGLFDEWFKTPFCQDVDMGFQIKRAGFKIKCLPGKIVHHVSPVHRTQDEANRRYLEAKWRL